MLLFGLCYLTLPEINCDAYCCPQMVRCHKNVVGLLPGVCPHCLIMDRDRSTKAARCWYGSRGLSCTKTRLSNVYPACFLLRTSLLNLYYAHHGCLDVRCLRTFVGERPKMWTGGCWCWWWFFVFGWSWDWGLQQAQRWPPDLLQLSLTAAQLCKHRVEKLIVI